MRTVVWGIGIKCDVGCWLGCLCGLNTHCLLHHIFLSKQPMPTQVILGRKIAFRVYKV